MENQGGGQGLNWGGTKCPKIFLGGAILTQCVETVLRGVGNQNFFFTFLGPRGPN